MSEEYSYSADGERYSGNYQTAKDAAIAGFHEYADHDQLYVGRNKHWRAADFVNAHNIIDNAAESAADECGECSEDWLTSLPKNTEAMAELEELVGAFLEKHEPVHFWTVDDPVEMSREEVGLSPGNAEDGA